jgi:hypothetical protein
MWYTLALTLMGTESLTTGKGGNHVAMAAIRSGVARR